MRFEIRTFRLRASIVTLMSAILIATVLFVPLPGQKRVSRALIMLTPYTNAVFAPGFESQARANVPGILRLEVRPAFTSSSGSQATAVTNGVWIRVIVAGPTALEAQTAASAAAERLSKMLNELYGAKASVVAQANDARRFSLFRDVLKPKIERIVKE